MLYAPSLADDPQFVAWAARYERSLATPVEARQWVEMYGESDVRDVLPLVRAPALVVTPALAGDVVPGLSRYVADHLADVRAIEIPARDQWPFGDGRDALLEAMSSVPGRHRRTRTGPAVEPSTGGGAVHRRRRLHRAPTGGRRPAVAHDDGLPRRRRAARP